LGPVVSYFERFKKYLVIFLHWKMKMYRRKHFKWLGFAAYVGYVIGTKYVD